MPKTKEPKVKSNTKNIVALLQLLRPLLPGNVVKKSETEYVIDDKVKLELNYYCSWDREKLAEQVKTCYPHSIYITAYPEGAIKRQTDYSPSKGSVFAQKTYNKNSSDEFNLKGIAVAITKGIAATDKWIAARKEADAVEAAKEKKQEEARKELAKLLKPLGVFKTSYGLCLTSPDHMVKVEMKRVKDVEAPIRYDVSLDKLTKEQLETLFPIMKAIAASEDIEEEDDD